jgi:uracil-DNA glycosylase
LGVGSENCRYNKELSTAVTYRKLPPYIGSNDPKVLIIGHSPKVRTNTIIDTTLDLNNNRNLKSYIVNEVLMPLGLSLADCAATNAVKCMTNKMPEDIKLSKKDFMKMVFPICNEHLIEEINLLKPKLIISLSERVANLLQQDFGIEGKKEKMRDIFGTMKQLNISGVIYPWIPVVHIPKPRVRAHYFPAQTERLKKIGRIFAE